MARDRDHQRAKVKAAIAEVVSERFDSHAAAQAWLQTLSAKYPIRRRIGDVLDVLDEVAVVPGKDSFTVLVRVLEVGQASLTKVRVLALAAKLVHARMTRATSGYAADGRWSFTEYRHPEIRNHAALRARGAALHGWQYAYILYVLVRYGIGKEAGEDLKASYRTHGVRWKPKRERETTNAQLKALSDARVERNRDLIKERWEKRRRTGRGRVFPAR